MSKVVEVVGIDWSGARDAGRRAWICRAEGDGVHLRVHDLYRVADRAGPTVDDLLDHVVTRVVNPAGERWVGIDFPFSVTRAVAGTLVTVAGGR